MSRRRLNRSTTNHRARLAGAVMVLVVSVAALLPGGALAQPGPVSIDDIPDEWQLLEYRDASGKVVAVPPGISVTLQPSSGYMSGDNACGEYIASFEWTENSITIDPPDVTQRACDAVAQAVDDGFFSALAASGSLSLEGDILKSYDAIEGHLLTLTRAAIPPDPNIARWQLARIASPDGSIQTVTGLAPTMEFLLGGGGDDHLSGAVVGNTGCGAFLGHYQTSVSSMGITDVDTGPSTCTESMQQQADAFVATLAEITDFDVKPAGLTLKDEAGVARLALSPIIELGDRTWTPTEVLVNGKPLELSPLLDTSAVQFFGGRAEGITFCGRGFSGRSIAAGLALSTSQLSTDQKPGCRKPRNDQTPPEDVETAFLRALRQTASHALRGEELELLDRNGDPLMRLLPQADLMGPTWVLIRIDAKPGKRGGENLDVEEQTGSAPITANFREAVETVSGKTGAAKNDLANEYIANFDIPGAAQIRISGMDVDDFDGGPCPPSKPKKPMCVRQRQVIDLMEKATGYIVRSGDMRLLQDGAYSLWFRKQQSGAPTE